MHIKLFNSHLFYHNRALTRDEIEYREIAPARNIFRNLKLLVLIPCIFFRMIKSHARNCLLHFAITIYEILNNAYFPVNVASNCFK